MSTNPVGAYSDPAQVHLHLAVAWEQKGQRERARAHYEKALEINPEFVPALVKLGDLTFQLGHVQESLDYLERAVLLNGDDQEVVRRYVAVKNGQLLRTATGKDIDSMEAVGQAVGDNPDGKLDLGRQKIFAFHRSGWNYALAALHPLHRRGAVFFDGFIEDTFAWQHWREGIRDAATLDQLKRQGTFERLATSEERGVTPYTHAWAGVVHNPPNMPPWFHPQESPQRIFAKKIWQQSLEACVGLFALSKYQAKWVAEQTHKPVSALVHPTELPERQFDFEAFLANPHKKIIQVGWWLRKLSAIYRLPLARHNPLAYEKMRLVPHFSSDSDEHLKQLLQHEIAAYGLPMESRFVDNTCEQQHVTAREYDALLAENLAFMELYDASANNVVVECIARATPVFVNPLPAVVEYLGRDYPLYFEDLGEAAEKALDLDLIQRTHQYLKNCETRPKLAADYFRESVRHSQVYERL